MGELIGIKIEKLQGGLGRKAPSTDSHFGLVLPKLSNGNLQNVIWNLNKGIVLRSLEDAATYGIMPSELLEGNNKMFYHHISEFFRLAPEGTLYLYALPNDNIETIVYQIYHFLINNEKIKGIATISNRISSDPIYEHLRNYQTNIVDKLAQHNRLIDFVIVGDKGTVVGMPNIDDLTEFNFPNISCLIGASGNGNYPTDYDNTPAVGAFLGMLAARKVNENVGSVNIQNKPLEKRGTVDYPLTDAGLGVWVNPVLTDGQPLNMIGATYLKMLEEKGYLFAASYEGYPGVFFNNSKTCTSAASDFSNIENNRVWNKAARTLRQALMPEVKGIVKKNPTTGYIKSTTVSRWTGIANKALEVMLADDEISGYKVYINPEQIVNSDSPVKIQAQVVMDGIVHEFEVALGLTNSIN